MDIFAQLAACASATDADIKTLVASCCPQAANGINGDGKVLLIPQDASPEVQQVKRSILSNLSKLELLIRGPTDLLQQLSCHTQLLACLQWLGDFQVLACIPLRGSVPIKDVSDLAGVPEPQLSRIVRMTATFRFLSEPEPGKIAHSALSAPFVTNPSYLDAAMFLAGTAAPSALKMRAGTQRFSGSVSPNETAYNIASNLAGSFSSSCEQLPQLRRQWHAFLRVGAGDVDDGTVALIQSLQCSERLRAEPCTIVTIGAGSIKQAVSLANQYPSTHIIVQTDSRESMSRMSPELKSVHKAYQAYQADGRITVQSWAAGSPQIIRDAAVYIYTLHLFSSTSGPFTERILADLRSCMDVLRKNPSSTLILTSGLLPEHGTTNPDAEALARVRDLTLSQLTNRRELEMAEMMTIFNRAGDNVGRLILVNKICSPTSGALALEVRYQAYASG